MLPAPSQVTPHPAYAPILRLCSTVLLTAKEVAKHYRYDVNHVHNMRGRGGGPPWVKLGEGGAVRYRLSELIGWELAGHRGGLTLDRVSVALSTMPGMTADLQQKIDAHLQAVLGSDAGSARD